jgi:hypothetical protein
MMISPPAFRTCTCAGPCSRGGRKDQNPEATAAEDRRHPNKLSWLGFFVKPEMVAIRRASSQLSEGWASTIRIGRTIDHVDP